MKHAKKSSRAPRKATAPVVVEATGRSPVIVEVDDDGNIKVSISHVDYVQLGFIDYSGVARPLDP